MGWPTHFRHLNFIMSYSLRLSFPFSHFTSACFPCLHFAVYNGAELARNTIFGVSGRTPQKWEGESPEVELLNYNRFPHKQL